MILDVKPRNLTKEEYQEISEKWFLSPERHELQKKQKLLQNSIEVLNVGSYSHLERSRTIGGEE